MPSCASRAIIFNLAKWDDLEMYDAETTFRLNINAFKICSMSKMCKYLLTFSVLYWISTEMYCNEGEYFPMYSNIPKYPVPNNQFASIRNTSANR